MGLGIPLIGTKKKDSVHIPLYFGYDGKAYVIKKMSMRHLKNSIKGFRRKGFLPTWEYNEMRKDGFNDLYRFKPMAILDFLEIELKARS